MWNLPGGGYRPSRESPESAAGRESKEELGTVLTEAHVIGEYESTREGKRDTVTVVLARADGASVSLSTELTEARWFPLEALPDSVATAVKRGVEFLGGRG